MLSFRDRRKLRRIDGRGLESGSTGPLDFQRSLCASGFGKPPARIESFRCLDRQAGALPGSQGRRYRVRRRDEVDAALFIRYDTGIQETSIKDGTRN
ncbi:hypothetical protein [Paenibacillus lutrae]|uniref:Uncharacterized protein n=1 Tax=Paenibacillus lutrae TaxID=2078573 RepID=A0A7X3FLG1_9BACL|nr:hypothetical protein [Paenibacillus lutrae]MVP01949.1 hypothetical protein [Paenibacillus lutrae]